jgi:hypothetical protein
MSKNQSTQDMPETYMGFEEYFDFRIRTEGDAHRQEEKRRQEAARWNRTLNVVMVGNLLIFATYHIIKISKEIL